MVTWHRLTAARSGNWQCDFCRVTGRPGGSSSCSSKPIIPIGARIRSLAAPRIQASAMEAARANELLSTVDGRQRYSTRRCHGTRDDGTRHPASIQRRSTKRPTLSIIYIHLDSSNDSNQRVLTNVVTVVLRLVPLEVLIRSTPNLAQINDILFLTQLHNYLNQP